MKILLAYEWCEIGGVETIMSALATYLRARGHACEFFFFKRGPMEQFLPPDCPVHYGDLADCVKLVRARGYDIVHANSSDWKYGIEAVRAAGAKLVITAHGMVVPGWDSTNCDALVCCSRWQAQEQLTFTDVRVRLILNGIDTDNFQPARVDEAARPGDVRNNNSAVAIGAADASSPVVAWVGRGTDMVHKRIDRLAAIAPALRAAGLRIWIADPYGPTEVAAVVPEAARTLQSLAEFWGMVAKKDLPDFYRRVAASGGCILSTSVREGLPLVLAEAQACGCPAIGPDVRGVNEVVTAEGGGVIHPADIASEQLAALVVETLRDTDMMSKRRRACVAFTREQFSLGVMAQKYLRLYEEVLHKRPRQLAGLRTLRLLPRWRDYAERRWTAGVSLYEASRQLAQQGEPELASRLARLVLANSPTLYVRPARLRHLLKLFRQQRTSDGASASPPRGAKSGDGSAPPKTI
jgi:glycosyltransferase involved in cell wall biosynthesis